jgi:hypothetical protein
LLKAAATPLLRKAGGKTWRGDIKAIKFADPDVLANAFLRIASK